MSKKKNKKFQRKKGQKPANINQAPVIKTDSPQASSVETSEAPVIKQEENTNPDIEVADEQADFYDNKAYAHVKKDIKKILLIIVLLAAIFTGIYFLGLKTSVLTHFGDWIYKTAHIQTL